MQDGCRRGRHLGVADAGPRRHEVQFAGPDHGVHAGAVAVLHLAAEQPTDGLQSGMRMRRYVHAGAAPHVMGAVMVGEAPRPDQRPLPLRQRPPHPDRPGPAQRHLAGMQHPVECRSRAGNFSRCGVGVAHRPTVALRLSPASLTGHGGADHGEVMLVDLENAEPKPVSPARLVLDDGAEVTLHPGDTVVQNGNWYRRKNPGDTAG